jgi:aspartate/methionine/tyrosine aminotransferase
MMRVYRRRRDLLVNGLNSLPGVNCLKPDGAFYVFPNIKKTGHTSESFAHLMLEKAKVALLPGTNFGEYGQGYVRLCYATSEDRIIEGIRRMKNVLG